MDKPAIVQAILAALREDFEARQRSSRQTRAAGNDAESKAEGKYDTRSTEENYLADGLARQAAEAMQAIAAYDDFEAPDFAPGEPIDLGALVRLKFGPSDEEWFFLGPAGGGVEIQSEGRTITVITPESPLGSRLSGAKQGTALETPKAVIVEVR